MMSLGLLETFELNGDYVSAGVGLRSQTSGTISLSTLPMGSEVEAAYLYYGYLDNTESPALSTIDFQGQSLTATLIGTGVDTNWGRSHSYAYRADVTSHVRGNGDYDLSNVASSATTLAEGASLVVVFRDASQPLRRISLYQGNDVLNADKVLSDITNAFGDILVGDNPELKTTWIVGDGQAGSNRDERVTFSGSQGTLRFDDVFSGSDGLYWDTITRDVSSVVRPGLSTVSSRIEALANDGTEDDYLMWVAQVVSSRINPPIPTELAVTATAPAKNSVVTSAVDRIDLAFNMPVDRATRWPGAFEILASGGDETFGNGNDRAIVPESVSWDATTNTISLILPQMLARDAYRVTAGSILTSESGDHLDQDYAFEFRVPNSPPLAASGRLSINQGQPAVLTLNGRDLDGDAVTTSIQSPPLHGTLTPTADPLRWTYVPATDFSGSDSFTFIASDGLTSSAPATFALRIVRARPDLSPAGLEVSAPAGLAMGQPVRLSWTDSNLGPGATIDWQGRDWTDRIYLSRDPIFDGSDILVGSRAIDAGALTAGAIHNTSLDIVLPDRPEWSGPAYMLVVSDAEADQPDTSRSNNVWAEPVVLRPTVRITAPYRGQYVDTRRPVTFRWNDSADQGSGLLSIALDTDDDPRNGTGHVFLARDIAEDPDGAADEMRILLPGRPNGTYHVWMSLSDGAGTTYSKPIPIQYVDQAFTTPDTVGDTVGGSGYEIFGVDLARLGDRMLFRVRTNFDVAEDPSRYGDLVINVGGSLNDGTGMLVGLAVSDRTTSSGATVKAGRLYRGATFDGGDVVSRVPTDIRGYATEVSGGSSLAIARVTGLDWTTEVTGSFTLAAAGARPGQRIEVSTTMYCGNDQAAQDNQEPTDDEQPPAEDPKPNLLGTRFEVVGVRDPVTGQLRPFTPGDLAVVRWGDVLRLEYSVANHGDPGSSASGASVAFYFSTDSTIDANDQSIGYATLSTLAADDQADNFTLLVLPDKPPAGFETLTNFYVGMIIDRENAVEETNEDDNSNLGSGQDKQLISVREPGLIQVITHGWNWKGLDSFYTPWDGYERELNKIAADNHVEDLVENKLITWNSHVGFTDYFIWKIIGYADNVKTIAELRKFDPIEFILGELIVGLGESISKNVARVEMKRAANAVTRYVTSIKAAQPMDQVLLVGHSRGGVVMAEASRLLAQANIDVDQYIALDGFATDWPSPADDIADGPIAGAVSAGDRISYRVFYPLGVDDLSWVFDRLPTILSDYLRRELVKWDLRAPVRAGFSNPEIPGTRHTNIADAYFYSRFSDQVYATRNLFGDLIARHQRGSSPVIHGALALAGSMAGEGELYKLGASPEDEAGSMLIDGDFEWIGRLQSTLRSLTVSLAPTGDPDMDSLLSWLQDPSTLLGSLWQPRGNVQIVTQGTNSAVELTQSADAVTSITQPLILNPTAQRLTYDLDRISAGPGDVLEVWWGDQLLDRVVLSQANTLVSRSISLADLVQRDGELQFRLTGPASDPAVILLDNLLIDGQTYSPPPVQEPPPPLDELMIDAGGPYAVDEGQAVELTASGSNQNSRIGTYSWDLDGDGEFETIGQSATFSAIGIDGPASRQVTVRVLDDRGRSATATTTVTVRNTPPTISLMADQSHSLVPDVPFTFLGRVVDAGHDAFSVNVDYGDGSPITTLSPDSSGGIQLEHTYSSPGTFTVTVTARDDDGGVSIVSLNVQVIARELATIRRVDRVGVHFQPTSLVLHVSGSLDSGRLESPSSYVLIDPGRDRRFGTRDDRRIAINSVSYDPGSNQLTLRPAQRLKLSNSYRLTVRSGAGGLEDSLGRALDGNNDGVAGGDFSTTITRSNLVPIPTRIPPRLTIIHPNRSQPASSWMIARSALLRNRSGWPSPRAYRVP